MNGSPPPQGPGARNGDLLVFAMNGFAVASWTSRIPDVKSMLSLTPGRMSLLLLAVSAGSLCSLPLAGRVVRAIGATRAVRVGLALCLPGLALAGLAVQLRAPQFCLVAALVATGMGMGLWDVAQNIEGTAIEQALDKAVMPWFHAAFSAGTVFAALVGAALTWFGISIAVHLAVVAVLVGLAAWWGSAHYLGAGAAPRARSASRRAPPARSAWTEPRTLLIGVMVLASSFTEGTANDWMAVAFVEGHGLSAALGVIALAVFLVFMTCGRMFGTRLLDRHGRVPVLRVLFTMAVLGCLIVVFGPSWLAFAGAALWGIGASLGSPVGMSAAGDNPFRASYRIGVVSTIGYAAFLGGPPLLGFLGDHFGVLRSLLAVGAMSVLAAVVARSARPVGLTD